LVYPDWTITKIFVSDNHKIPIIFLGWRGNIRGMDITETLSRNLRYAMEGAGIKSQRQLSMVADISQQMVGFVLNRTNSISVTRLEKMVSPLGIQAWQALLPHEVFKRTLGTDFLELSLALLSLSPPQRQPLVDMIRSLSGLGAVLQDRK